MTLLETYPMSLLDRFLRYVKIDTQANELSRTVPSTPGQLDLCRLLESECREMGLQNVSLSQFGTVMATIPATFERPAPTIAWVAHVDTAHEASGANVKPVVHRNYAGGDIVLPGDKSKIIRVDDNPALKNLLGATIVTSDGTTLLGADDKAGVAVIMSAAAHLVAHPEIVHGEIRVCFTCDEEIGHGVDHLDLEQLDAACAYTLDGEGQGGVDVETFSADQAIVTVTGVNTHPSIGKGKMINALRILAEFITRVPTHHLSPETTEGREGFIHPYAIEGGVAKATARIILRDFETERLKEYDDLLQQIADDLRRKHSLAKIEVDIVEQYRNMREGLARDPRAVDKAVEAIRAAGMEPRQTIIRGGTDGSRLTALGLPTPNLATGEHNIHSPLEWTSVEEMQSAVDVLVQLAQLWGRETKTQYGTVTDFVV